LYGALSALTVVCGIVAAISATATASASTARSGDAPAVAHTAVSKAPHILTIMMENTDYSQVAGSAATPYMNELQHQYADFTQAYGWTYPSLPNYVELQAGSTHGISSDCDPGDKGCTNLSGTFMENQLEAKGISWHAYYEDDVSGCNTNSNDDFHGNYDVEHNPWRYFSDFSAQCSHISGFGQLLPDLRKNNAPDYNFVVPDLNNDGGDNGTMSSGDTWLNATLPKIMKTEWYKQGGQIVVMYDTGYQDGGGVNGSSGGRIPMMVISAHTRGMGQISTRLNTAGVLRSLEQAYGLSYLGDAANAANGSLGKALVAGRPTGKAAAKTMSPALAQIGTADKVKLAGVKTGLAFNGVHHDSNGSVIAVGENTSGEGVVWTKKTGEIAVPGTSNLESVACETSKQCYAVGLATAGSDVGVLVPIVNGRPKAARIQDAFYGIYGIACPSKSKCVAVGYSTATIGDAVTTITHGVAAKPKMVPGGGEWLNAVACPTSNECYATGLVNYVASIVPIKQGTPKAAIAIPKAWYANGITCQAVGDCVVVGENDNQQGTVTSLTGGKMGKTSVVSSSEYLYGVGCVTHSKCVITGASHVGKTGYSHGQSAYYIDGKVSKVKQVADANGLGQISCGKSLTECVSATATDHR
jgi:phosphatidylinositol-3-phosphatase